MKCQCGHDVHIPNFCPECGRKLSTELSFSSSRNGSKKSPFMNGIEAAAFLKISKTTLYKMAKAGQVPVIMIGNVKRFHSDELLAHFKSEKPEEQ